jgi:CheY-like chemotaxis protein
MKSILLVEDEFAVLAVLAMALEAEGLEVLKAGDGVEALGVLAARRCDAVIADAVMPFLDGSALLARMRQRDELAEVPFILMAHRHDPRPEAASIVLEKPVRLARLLEALRQLALL